MDWGVILLRLGSLRVTSHGNKAFRGYSINVMTILHKPLSHHQ
jgi:hypothetical protein